MPPRFAKSYLKKLEKMIGVRVERAGAHVRACTGAQAHARIISMPFVDILQDITDDDGDDDHDDDGDDDQNNDDDDGGGDDDDYDNVYVE